MNFRSLKIEKEDHMVGTPDGSDRHVSSEDEQISEAWGIKKA